MTTTTHDLFAEDVTHGVAFLDTYERDQLGVLAQQFPTDKRHLTLSYRDLTRSSDLREVAERKGYTNGDSGSVRKWIHADPGEVHALLEEAAAEYDLPVDIDLTGVDIRISDLPESVVYGVNELWKAETGDFCGVRGQVQKRDRVRKRPETLAFECQRCATTTNIPQHGDDIQEPHECKGCDRQGPFVVDHDASEWVPHQLVRVQQPPEETKGGEAAYVDIPLEDSLVEAVDAGDRATFAGTQQLEQSSDDALFDPYLDPESAEIEETDFEEVETGPYEDEIARIADGEYGRPLEAVVDSIAPKIHGHRDIKRAMALQLFSGVRAEYPDGTVDRGDIHLLMIGAPGTGKSNLLRTAENLAPRSVYASGKGASAAGMTAAAVRDDFGNSEWALEAGALVLANKGVACVDEIDKVDDEARSSMHDALESQRVNVNKAGINATLPAQTSLLAAGNPKYGRFDRYASESLSEQIDLGPTLLSRFDLIFLLQDQPDRDRDRKIAEHSVESHRKANAYSDPNASAADADFDSIEPTIGAETLRAYVAYAKQNIRPRIEDPAVGEELVDSFVEWRSLNGEGDDVAVPVTFRKLEGVRRLAQASARLRLSETVEREDIDVARDLVMESMRQVGMDTEEGGFDADMVESSTPKSQRDRVSDLLDIIAELADDTGASPSLVLDRMVSAGHDRDTAEREISKQKMNGAVYEAGDGLRVTDE